MHTGTRQASSDTCGQQHQCDSNIHVGMVGLTSVCGKGMIKLKIQTYCNI